MANPPTPRVRTISRQAIPLHVVRGDMANGCVPTTYLQSRLKPRSSSAETLARDLLPPNNPDKLNRLVQALAGASTSRTFLVSDKSVFVELATECLLCGVASIGIVDPAQISQSFINATARGTNNEFVYEYLSCLDLIFLDAAVAPVVTNYMQVTPSAAHLFYSFVKTSRYASTQHLVLDVSARLSRGPSMTESLDIPAALTDAYGHDTANLLLSDALTL